MSQQTSTKYFHFVKSRWCIAIGCFVLGAAVILGIRFATYKPADIHYHANFEVYINGQREQFKGATYYTETEMCNAKADMTPTGRAHMHDNVNNVVHVEDHAVTWGQFFTNIGWTLGATTIITPDGTIYAEHDQDKLNIVVNGQDYTDLGGIANRVIQDKDKLLLSYGDQSTGVVMAEYKSIPSTAQHYDTAKDPSSCAGSSGPTMHDRYMHMF